MDFTSNLKYVVRLLAPVFMHIYHLALCTAVFRKEIQVAKVTAIHKGGGASNLSNFRPISTFPVISKGLEKGMYTGIHKFLMKHCLIWLSIRFPTENDHRSSIDEAKDIIIDGFEAKQLVHGIYVNFSKAFDLLSHDLYNDAKTQKLWNKKELPKIIRILPRIF